MKSLFTTLVIAAAFYLGTQYTLTPRTAPPARQAASQHHSVASVKPVKPAKAKPAAPVVDLGF